jgi:hypothetical protein
VPAELGDLGCPADLQRGTHLHGRVVGAKHDVGVEEGEQPLELSATRGRAREAHIVTTSQTAKRDSSTRGPGGTQRCC